MEDRKKEKVADSSQPDTKTLSYVPPKVIRMDALNVGRGDDCYVPGVAAVGNCSTGAAAVQGNCLPGSGADENCSSGGSAGHGDSGSCLGSGTGAHAACTALGNTPEN